MAFRITGLVFPATLDLRNGVAADVQAATRSAAIPPQFRWTAADIGHGPATLDITLLVVREAFGVIGAAQIARPTQTGVPVAGGIGFQLTAAGAEHAAGTVADWAPTVAAANADTRLRLCAIALGATRSGIAAYWRIGSVANDINANERSAVEILDYGASIAGNLAAAPPGQTDAAGTLGLPTALAIGMTPLTDMETEFAVMCLHFGAAAPVLAGCELRESGHHYLSSNIAATVAVERQMLATASEAIKGAWTGHVQVLRDIIWHKAAHPVSSAVMTAFAVDVNVKERLSRARLGSVAVRLPYVESTIRGARGMISIYNACQATIGEAGYIVQIPKLINALAYVLAFNPVVIVATETGYTPANRWDAMELYLRPVMDEAGPYIAWCAGMFRAMCDEAGIPPNANTLLRSRAVARCMVAHVGSTAAGTAAYDNYRRYVRTVIREGNLPVVNLVFAHVAPNPAPAAAPVAAPVAP